MLRPCCKNCNWLSATQSMTKNWRVISYKWLARDGSPKHHSHHKIHQGSSHSARLLSAAMDCELSILAASAWRWHLSGHLPCCADERSVVSTDPPGHQDRLPTSVARRGDRALGAA